MHDHSDFQDGLQLARAIVDTVREPLVVLNGDLRVVAASRSFYKTFGVNQREVYGRLLYELGGGQWDVPRLRELLEDIIPHRTTIEAYEVEHDFPAIGRRTMLLNARQVANGDRPAAILLAIEDVTRQRAAEHEKDDLLRQKDLLLREMRHRVANSLQIIASILLLKARTVQSEETRRYLQDAHQRVLTVATVQQQLEASGIGDEITIGPYLAKLCTSLAASMIGERWPLSVKVRASEGAATSNHVVSLGLITTELLINALKHAFPNDAEGEILVSYDADGADWQLSVSDNGIGRPADADDRPQGLGTSIVEALAKQLGARVSVSSSARGTTVSITHAAAWMPRPADQATPEGGPSQGT